MDPIKIPSPKIRSYTSFIAIGWTLIILVLLGIEHYGLRRQVLETARTEARTSIEKDLVYRRWNALHGGVYVPITADTPPNPYLQVSDRDVTTTGGLELTLMNPAYMTRQVLEMGEAQYGFRAHLTSLDPIRPLNAADPWETQALKAFEQGETEISSLETMDGEKYLRLMLPFFTEEPCLKCHAAQGYQVGDIRGGLSVSIPMSRYVAVERASLYSSFAGYATLWLLGVVGITLVSSDLKRRTLELQASEARHRAISELTSDYTFSALVEGDGQIVPHWVTGAFKQITGYSWDEFIAMGSWPSIVYPDDLPDDQYDLETLLENRPISRELRIVTKSGEVRWIQNFVRPVWDDQEGRVIELIGAVRDITKRKRAEEALRESEERFSTLAEAAFEGIGISDKGRIIDCNEQLATMLGYEQSEMIGLEVSKFVAPVSLDIVLEHIKSGSEKPYEHMSLRKDGTKFPVEIRAKSIPYQGQQVRVTAVRDVTERKKAEEKLAQQLERLRALHKIDQTITTSIDLKEVLDLLVEEVATQLHVDAVSVLLLDQEQRLNFTAGCGFLHTDTLKYTRLPLGQGLAGRAAAKRQIVHIDNLRQITENPALAMAIANEEFVAYYGVPLIAKDQVCGVLEVFHRSTLAPSDGWLDFLETLAGQAAISVDNATLFDELQQSNRELNLAYDATLKGWSRALDLRDKETEGHTQRVIEMTVQLARKLGFSEDELIHIQRGALLHDIGKMGVPDSILLKPGPLTDEEWVIMRKHPEYAYEMLLPIQYLHPALAIPHFHHERWDGSGYPNGLKGEEIPLAARIFAVVDVWDALNSDRPYREAWSRDDALAYIQEQAGAHFDPQVVRIFLEVNR